MRNKSLTLTTVVAMLVNLVGAGLTPLPAVAAPASGYAFASLGALPSWFTGVPALADAHHAALPAWFGTGHGKPASGVEHLASGVERPAPSAGHSASGVLPAWFSPAARQPESTNQHPAPSPLLSDIPLSLLTVDVTGPGVASLGSPLGSGEVYTAVIRNNSPDTAYGLYLTATHPAFFVHDGGDQIISRTGTIPFNLATGATAITWTPVTTYNLVPGEAITLNFKLRAACDAQSGKRLEVGVRYNADPLPPVELNFAGLNVTTGHGNLVIKKEPAFQYLGTPDFGKPITWTVTVQNTGLGLLYDAIITDTGGISLSQPSGDLVPTATIPLLDINESRVFTVVGTVEACNFTNVALASWTCGNLVGDATVGNPVSSTVSVYFTPQVPQIDVQVSSPITFPYCEPVTRTVVMTINNTGGPAANFRLDSTFESDGFLEVITPSVSGDWQYNPSNGYFSYLGGSPGGTIPGAGAGGPVTLTFQVRPLSSICGAGSGDVVFTPLYNDICTDAPFTGNPTQLAYQYAQDEAPTLSISKSGPGVVASGDVFTYLVTVSGQNPDNISGAVNVTDVLPSEFELQGYAPSTGTVTPAGQTVVWSFDPPDSPATFSEFLVITAQVVITEDICGASQIVDNDVEAFAVPTCPDCSPLNPSDQVNTAIENNEGVFPSNSVSPSSFEVCGDGFAIYNSYLITGSYVVTWTGAVFTEALGTPIGDGALTGTTTYLMYQADSLSVTVNGVDYTTIVTPVTSTGQLVIDLSPLQAAGAPTQNLTLMITYTVAISEGSLSGFVERTFHDWSQLFLPNFSDVEGCAANNSFNQVLLLTIGRGDLSLGLAPRILDRCSTNPVILTVNDNAPGRLTDHIVVTFTSSSSEIRSARNFTTTGSLPDISSITVVSDADIGAGLGIITFTFPTAFDPNGDGEIRFEVDINCVDESPWNAGIVFESFCGFPHGDTTSLTHIYRTPNLLLFATPVRIPLRERDVNWIFFVTNNGNLTATNVVVTNTVESLAVFNYTPDGPGVALSGTLPITSSDVVFTIDEIGPGVQRAVTVTARAIQCELLHVTIRAGFECFDEPCAQPQAEIPFDVPRPYLLTNNGETADLPMCDIGEVIFTTKNASPDVSLYNVDITETLRGLAPAAGEPITVTVVDDEDNVVASTTTFTPEVSTLPTETVLIWKAISATTEVVTWFQALPPLYVIRIFVPVRTDCIPPNVPESFAAASAQGPCNQHLGYTEDAFTLRTLQPDMEIFKDGKVFEAFQFGETIYAAPAQTVTWRIRVYNYPSSRSYVGENVVLSDTWPSNFEFITASVSSTQVITAHVVTATRTITWDVGDMPPSNDPLVFFITGTVAITDGACSISTTNMALLAYGCEELGCTADPLPLDTAELEAYPNLTVELHPDPLPTCEGDIPITIRNYGARAYSTTLTVTLPGGYVYSHTVSSGLTPTEIITSPTTTPRFKWDMIPGRLGSSAPPYSFTMVLRVENSGSGGEPCPSADGQPVTATLSYDDHFVCTASGPFFATDSVPLAVLTPDLRAEKSPRTQTVGVDEAITWTLTVTNTGNVTAEYMLITDVVASNFTNVTATVGSDGSPPTVVTTTNTITWTPSDIAPNGVWTAAVSAVLIEFGVNRNMVTATAYCATDCRTAIATDTAYATLLEYFDKSPPIQTGTIGSLVVFTLSTLLSDEDALYEDLTLTDTLPTGLGYVSSWLTATYDGDGNQGGRGDIISNTPTITPGWLASGDVVWALGDLSGTVQIRGVLTAVIQDDPVCYDGARLTNDLRMTYTDDGQPYVYTDTTDVDVQEPILHIGKTYVTPYGCDATLFQDDFNDGVGWGNGTWSVVDGVYQTTSGAWTSRFAGSTAWTDYSFSAMMRSDGDRYIGLYFRYQDANNFYLLYWRDGASPWLRLRRRVGGSDTDFTLSGYSYIPGRWYHVEIRGEGALVQAYIDGQQVFTDTAPLGLRNGRIGVYSGQGAGAVKMFDDILATRLDDMACTVGANDLVTYTLVVSNQARLTGYDLVITDSIPDGTSLVTYTMESDDPASGVVDPSPIPGATGVLTWGIDQLIARSPFDPLNHTALTLTVVLAVADGITANITLPNQAWLAYDNWLGSSEPVGVDRDYSGGSHSTAVRTVNGGIAKVGQFSPPPTATLGTLVTYTLIVPASPITATLYDVVITDTVNPSMTIASVITAGGTGGLYRVAGQVVTATFASIPHDTQAFVTITSRISDELGAYAGYVITNSALMTHETGGITETETISTPVSEPSLTLVKASDPPTSSTVGAGDRITYSVTIANAGWITASPAYDVMFTDTLPIEVRDAGPSFITVTLNGVPVSLSSYVVGYAAGVLTITFTPAFSIPVGQALLIEYAVIVNDDVGAGLDPTNRAEVTWSSLPAATPGDRDYGPEEDSTQVHTVRPGIDKDVTPSTATLGDVITYTILVPAQPISATIYDVTVTDWLDSRLMLQSVTDGPDSTVIVGANSFTVTYPVITSTLQRVITFTAILSSPLGASAGDLIANQAVLSHATDIAYSDWPFFRVTEPDLSILKVSDPPTSSTVEAGDSVTYTVRITNGSGADVSAAYDLVFTDTLPDGMRHATPSLITVTLNGAPVSASDYGTGYNSLTGVFTITFVPDFNIPVGGVLVIEYVAALDVDVAAGLHPTNRAEVTWSSLPAATPGDRDYGPASDTTTVHTPIATDLSKVGGPPTVTIGSRVFFTVTVPDPPIGAVLLNVIVTDVVDSRLEIESVTNASYSGQVVTASFASIPTYTQQIICITTAVRDLITVTAGTQITNNAIFDYAGNPTGTLESDVVTVTVVEPALTLVKASDPPTTSTVGSGYSVTYTVAITNAAWVTASLAHDIVFTDTLPTYMRDAAPLLITVTLDGAAVDSGDYTTGYDGATGVFTVAFTSAFSIPLGGELVIQYVALVDSDVPAREDLTNQAQVAWSSLPGPVTGERGYGPLDDSTTVHAGIPTLDLEKSATPSPVQAGDNLTYTLTVVNSGIVSATGVVISDAVPLNTAFVTATLPHTGPVPGPAAGSVISWYLGTLHINAPRTVTMVVQVASPLISGTLITNTAWVTSSEGISDTDQITTPVTSWHDLVITKTATPSPVEAGVLLTYTLEWEVVGNEPSLDTTISDTTPVSTTFWAAIPAAAAGPGVGGSGTVIWSLGDQNPSASGVVTMVVRVDSPILTGTLLYNSVLITDTQGVTDTDEITTPVTSWHDLVITKTAVPSPVRAGDLLTYTLAWEVAGNEPSLDTTISDTTPVSTTFWAASPPTATTPAVGGTGTVIWALGDQNPPASGVVTMVVRVNTPLLTDTVLYNAVLITDTQGISDTDEITTLVRSWHTLTVTKAAEPSPVAAGDLLTYTLEWQVAGNEPSLNTTISDTTPVSTTFWAAIPPAASDPGVGGTGPLVWYLGNQYPPAVGAVTGVVTMVVRVDSTAVSGTLLYNAAVITDSQGVSDTDDITTPVETWADVTVVKADDPDPVTVGTLLTYTLVVTNNGPSDAHDVVVTDRLPPEVSFITATTPVTVALPDLAWPLGTMTPGAVRHLTVTVRVLVTTTAVFTNSSVVTTTTPEDNPGNNDDDESTTPLVPSLEILKTVAPGQAARNMPFTYTLRINNTGQVTFDPLRVTDTLPADFYYVVGSGSPSDPDVISGSLLVWQNLGPLAPAASITVTFAVTASPGITGTYVNVATSTGTTPGGTITDTDDAPVDIEQPAVEVDKQVVGIDRDEVAPNYVTFTIAITNVGPSVIDVLPLVDQYDTYYLSFTAATPYPEQDADDGLITWNDLTGPAPNGFGRNLGLGERFLVTTVFRVAHDITITTTNVVTTTNAVDDYDNPAEDDDDEEDIGGEDQPDIPTPIEILYFRAVAEETTVRLEWATIAELGTVGFHIYRAASASFGDAQAIAYVPATGPGSTYSHVDRDVEAGQPYWYWLVEDVVGDEPDIYGPVRGGVGIGSLPHRLYLPLIQRGWGEQEGTSRLHGSGLRLGLAARLCCRWWR